MPNIHNITCDDVLSILFMKWFKISHQKWSHIQLKKDDLRVTVPNHWSKTLNIRTVFSILKQSWLSKKDLK